MPDPTGRVSHIPEMHRGFSWKPAVRCATTANITISTGLNAGDTIDGVTLAAGDRVLVKNQSTASQNGIYIAGATPVRAADMDQDGTTSVPAEEIAGAVVFVIAGTTNTKTFWYTTNGLGGTIGSTSIAWTQFTSGGGGGSSGLAWFNVMDATYGAVNDGSTNDRSAINAAIAAFNAAGGGVLYFPRGAGYKVTGGALTTITGNGIIIGDGMGAYDGSAYVSAILFDSQTAVCFTHTGKELLFRDLGIFNVYAGNPSAGAGIQASGSFIGQKVDYDSIVVSGFYIDIDVQVGAQWSMHNTWIWAPVLYGVKVQNTVNADAGDWTISQSYFYADTHAATSLLRVDTSGGGRVTGCKFNNHGSGTYGTGIDVTYTGGTTTIFGVSNCSLENFGTTAIKTACDLVQIVGNEFGHYSGTNVDINITGGDGVTIVGNVFKATTSPANAISSAGSRVYVSANTFNGYTASIPMTGSGYLDGSGGVGSVVFITGTPTSGQVPTATSGTAATWQTPSGASLTIKDEGSTLDTAVTSIDFVGAGVTATNVSHAVTVTIPAATGIGPILISDTPSTPLVFADLIQNEAQDDLVYADP